MRTLAAVLLLLSACELQPAPRIQQRDKAAPPAPAEPPRGLSPSGPPPGADLAGSKREPFSLSPNCNDIGTKVADTLIAEARDPQQSQSLKQERARIIRRTAETCTRDKWPEAAQRCFIKASTGAELQLCGKDLAAPRDEDDAPANPKG